MINTLRALSAFTLLILTISLPLRAQESQTPVIWEVQNQWNQAYEDEFGRWLGEVAPDRQFFERLNIGIDCADVTYGFRWIFSRIHHLPAMATTLNGIMTNESFNNKWSYLPTASEWSKDQRFLTALDYLLRSTYTGSLAQDSYPVEISAQSLQAGTFFLNLDTSSHVDLIYKSTYTDRNAVPFEFVSSSVPRQIKPTKYLVFWFESQPDTESEGFRRFLWPRKINSVWSYENPVSMPYYSNEQFDKKWKQEEFWREVYARVKPDYSRKAMARLSIDELVKYLIERAETVEAGYEACGSTGACSEKSKLFDAWSTPSRDKRIQKHFAATRLAVGPLWPFVFRRTPAVIVDGKTLNLRQLLRIWKKQRFNSDPRVPKKKRWGI